MQFQNTTLSAEMLQAIATQNFTEMTEIQAKTIPLLLEGKDVIGKSNTGTGKTAAFSIPIIEQIPKDAEPFVICSIMGFSARPENLPCRLARKSASLQNSNGG